MCLCESVASTKGAFERTRKHDDTLAENQKGKKDKMCFMNILALQVQSMAINVDFIEWFASYYEFRLEQMECVCVRCLGFHKSQMLNKLDYRSIHRCLAIV